MDDAAKADRGGIIAASGFKRHEPHVGEARFFLGLGGRGLLAPFQDFEGDGAEERQRDDDDRGDV